MTLLSKRLSTHSDQTDSFHRHLTLKEIHFGAGVEQKRFLFDPSSKNIQRWDLLIILLVFYVALTLPFELGFKPEFWLWYLICGILVDVLFVADIVICFFTTFKDPETHFYVNDYNRVAKRYLSGWFFVDICSVFPFEIFAIGSGESQFRMFKCVRLLRLTKVYQHMQNISTSEASNMARLSWMVILFMLIIHWNGCFFAGVAIYNSGDDNWIDVYTKLGLIGVNKSSQYIAALYWSAMTVTTVGYGDIVPQNDSERVINSIAMIVGALIYAVIFGNISLYIANLNRDETNYQESIGTLLAHMKDISLPNKLQRKVLSYHDYIWKKNHGENGNKLGMIPQRVQTEVAVLVHGRMIRQNAAFANAPESFINAAALALRFTVCLPNEFVFQQGEIAESIFFIARGQVGVFREEFGSMTVLGKSSFFGENPFFLERKRDSDGKYVWQKRKHSVITSISGRRGILLSLFRAHSVRGYAYCDLWKMDFNDLDEIMNSHPSLRSLMSDIALERAKQEKFYDDDLMTHKIGMKFIRETQKRHRLTSLDKYCEHEDDVQTHSHDSVIDEENEKKYDESRLQTHNTKSNVLGVDMLSRLEKHIISINDTVAAIDTRATNISAQMENMNKRAMNDRSIDPMVIEMKRMSTS